MKGMHSRRMRRRGFTLVELLVVMFILVLLAGTVTAIVIMRTEDAKHARAVAEIQQLKLAIDSYKMDNQEYPAALEDLFSKPAGADLPNWRKLLEKPIFEDPWKRAYVYKTPGEHNEETFDIYTLGKDGKEGGEKNDADVTNW